MCQLDTFIEKYASIANNKVNRISSKAINMFVSYYRPVKFYNDIANTRNREYAMVESDYKIIDADLNNPQHISDILTVLENYKTGEMGDGIAYTDSEKARLITQFIVHPNVMVVLLYTKGEIAAGSVCFKSFSTFNTDNIINIHDLCVIDKFRGRGFGRALTEYIVQKGREQLCSRLTLEVREDNGIAQDLYKKFGFDDMSPKMHFWRKKLQHE